MQINENNEFTSRLAANLVSINFDADSYTQDSFTQFTQPLPVRLQKAVTKRQAEYLAGRICATRTLESIGHNDAIVETSDSRAPIWPHETIGAITHTKGIAMAVALPANQAKGIGIDVEKHMTAEQEVKLQTQILRDDEAEIFRQLGHTVSCPLSIVFSAKESIYKALYPSVNKFFGFEKAKLVRFDPHTLTFKITEQLSEQVSQGLELVVHYHIAPELVFSECMFI